jgi:surface antigen
MPLGHVAMVSEVISEREVLLTHANWSRRGRVETNVRAIDVSAAGDWSEVRVWFGPLGGLGTSVNAAKGFIYADHNGDELVPLAPMTMASADTSNGDTAAF